MQATACECVPNTGRALVPFCSLQLRPTHPAGAAFSWNWRTTPGQPCKLQSTVCTAWHHGYHPIEFNTHTFTNISSNTRPPSLQLCLHRCPCPAHAQEQSSLKSTAQNFSTWATTLSSQASSKQKHTPELNSQPHTCSVTVYLLGWCPHTPSKHSIASSHWPISIDVAPNNVHFCSPDRG